MRKLLVISLLLSLTACAGNQNKMTDMPLKAPQSSYATKTTPVAGDKVLIVDSESAPQWQTKNVLFSAFGSGTPGGSDTYVQFNDGGVFGGDAGLTYNKTTDTLSVTKLATLAADGYRTSDLPNNTAISPQGGGIEEIYNEAGAVKLVEGDIEFHVLGVHKTATTSTATSYTIGTDSPDEAYGGTVYVTATSTITAPAVLSGMNFTVVTIGNIVVSLDVNAADKMILDGVTLDDGDKATNTSAAGDTITCQYYSADGYYCWSGTVLGTHWTDTGN